MPTNILLSGHMSHCCTGPETHASSSPTDMQNDRRHSSQMANHRAVNIGKSKIRRLHATITSHRSFSPTRLTDGKRPCAQLSPRAQGPTR
jgi:hypothetical protein